MKALSLITYVNSLFLLVAKSSMILAASHFVSLSFSGGGGCYCYCYWGEGRLCALPFPLMECKYSQFKEGKRHKCSVISLFHHLSAQMRYIVARLSIFVKDKMEVGYTTIFVVLEASEETMQTLDTLI